MHYHDASSNLNALTLTGIPPYIVLFSNIGNSAMMEEFKKELDARFVGGDEYQANQVLQQVKELNNSILSVVQANCANDSSQDGTFPGSNVAPGVSCGSTTTPLANVDNDGAYRSVFYYDGKLFNVPEGYQLPKMRPYHNSL